MNPIDVLTPMLRDLAAQSGYSVDETAIAEARAYCDEMVPLRPCEHLVMRHERHWDVCANCGARWSPVYGWNVPLG